MALGDIAGHAKTSPRTPQAQGTCDRCGFVFALSALRRQSQWAGARPIDTGYLTCSRCTDVPQDQFRTIILPPDPFPRTNPRPDQNATAWPPSTSPGNLGFTQYVLGSIADNTWPTTKAAVLAQVATLSGIATPGSPNDYGATVAASNVSFSLIPANPARAWLLLYNPAASQIQIALGAAAVWGLATNLILGPGQAYFFATAQGLGAVYQGALAAIGLIPGVPVFGWDG